MPTVAPTTVGSLVNRGIMSFTQANLAFGHGVTNARDEAIYLTLHALKLPLDELPLARTVVAADAARVLALFERRIKERKPVAYITQEAWLGTQRFFVDERVLVPRSYIAELLFDDDFPFLPAVSDVHTALDLCTGSGCLAILLAKRFRKAMVDATDVSPGALQVAAINVKKHRLKKRVNLLFSNYFSRLNQRRYDLIISNPPYVNSGSMQTLPREYQREPQMALDGGADGMDLVRRIVAGAKERLSPNGVLVVEIGNEYAYAEAAFGKHELTWLSTSAGDEAVFLLNAAQL